MCRVSFFLQSKSVWLTMRYGILVMTILFTALGGEPGRAAYCEGGQRPVPPALAARMALPACGFDATKRWGPNGCQLCDPRYMYPNPYAAYRGPARGRLRRHR